ncbi:hypothetical protein DFH08DRAFT_819534 [Mycena albidolilacea]|uniref:Uncharacterized protein n=1 Tax=Mycena albidolilacea TaxID=1033008 RepID=A0AAD6ZEW3_9AGAR|nr:hypothetical protein DFH08DRAFT_819534 [Mycena albidolilacea]
MYGVRGAGDARRRGRAAHETRNDAREGEEYGTANGRLASKRGAGMESCAHGCTAQGSRRRTDLGTRLASGNVGKRECLRSWCGGVHTGVTERVMRYGILSTVHASTEGAGASQAAGMQLQAQALVGERQRRVQRSMAAVDVVRGGGGVCMRAQREGGEAQPQPQRAYMHRRVYSAAGAVHGGRAGSGVPNAGGVAAINAQRVRDEWWMHAGWIRLARRWVYGRRCGKCGMTYVWAVDVASAGVRDEREHSGLQTQMQQRQESLRREARDSGAAGTGHRLSQKAVGTGISGAAGVCGGEWRRSRSEAAGSHQGLGTPQSSSAGAASAHWQRAQRAGGGRGRKGASHV